MGSWRCSYASMSTKNLPNPNTDITDLTPRERHQKILVREAAKIARVSEKTFRENYEHLIHKLTKRGGGDHREQPQRKMRRGRSDRRVFSKSADPVAKHQQSGATPGELDVRGT